MLFANTFKLQVTHWLSMKNSDSERNINLISRAFLQTDFLVLHYYPVGGATSAAGLSFFRFVCLFVQVIVLVTAKLLVACLVTINV